MQSFSQHDAWEEYQSVGLVLNPRRCMPAQLEDAEATLCLFTLIMMNEHTERFSAWRSRGLNPQLSLRAHSALSRMCELPEVHVLSPELTFFQRTPLTLKFSGNSIIRCCVIKHANKVWPCLKQQERFSAMTNTQLREFFQIRSIKGMNE